MCLALTFLHVSLGGGEHLIDSEGISSLFVAFILHLLDVWQAVHGTAEIRLPRLWVWTVDACRVFAYTYTETEKAQKIDRVVIYFQVQYIIIQCVVFLVHYSA